MNPKSKTSAPSNPLSQARADGRPQFYDIGKGDNVECALCAKDGNHAKYTQREAFLADPGNSPLGDGGVYTVCFEHLPDDAVIHDPFVNQTRTKDGQNVWREDDAKSGIHMIGFEGHSSH